MVTLLIGQKRSEDQGLRKKLAIIETLIFVLPFLIAFYLFYEKNLVLQTSDLMIVCLVFVLILGGLVFLRQIFDRILSIVSVLRKAETGDIAPVDIRGWPTELETLSVSLNRVMNRMERTTEKLGQKILELTAIRELYEVARKSLDFEALLNLALDKAMSVTGAKIGSFVVLDEGAHRYRLSHTAGIERELPGDSYIEIGDSFLKHVVDEGKSMIVQDIEHDSRTLKANDARYGPPSFMSMPILIESRVVAVLNLANKRSGELFTENDLQATSVMLDEIGFALENASLHARIKGHLQEILQQNRVLEQEIVERKTAEEKLRRVQDDLELMVEERTAELVAANEALEREIEERRRTEVILRDSEEKYRVHFSNVSDVIYSIGPDLSFLSASPSALHVLGYPPEKLIGRSLMECAIYTPEDQEKAVADIRRIMEQRRGASAVYEVQTTEEVKRVVEVRGTPLIREEQTVAVVCVARDITERKRLESELLQARKMEAIGTLAGGIAHDFNNVMTSIRGNASLMLLSLDASHPHYENLLQIEESIQSAVALTRQLLGFARGGKFKVQATNIGALVRKNAAMFSRTRKDVVFYESYQENPWLVEIDRGQIEQVLLNLFVNAVQAMPGGGEIHLATENFLLDDKEAGYRAAEPGRYMKLTVTDTGVGMDERTKERIFEPFFTTKEMGRGTGLGLSSVYGIIKGHAGFIDVFSEKGKGTTFHIYLPVSDTKESAVERHAIEKLYPGSETILLVDDEQMITTVCRAMLEKLGYRVLVAVNGQEAVDRYRTNQQEIDLVLMDMIMPGLGGDQVFDRLKAINPTVRIILATGYDGMDGKAVGLMERGCRGYIQKPFNIYALSRTIREVLDGTADAPSPSA
jgi:two-component system, cell cycle sensor histidine kinase and response regulator CckA